jgi:hypothetical protein
MKNIVGYVMLIWAALVFDAAPSAAQNKIDNERMDRDIEVAENALATMIRQQFSKNRYYGMEIKGNYTPGYGVTLRLPGEYNYVNAIGWEGGAKGGMAYIAAPTPPGVNGRNEGVTVVRPGAEVVVVDGDRVKKATVVNRDSAKTVYYQRVIQASKDFLADYGDLISQLSNEEKILITNRGDGYRYYQYGNGWGGAEAKSRTLMTVEVSKGDIVQYKQNKMSRDQIMAKIKVVNTESTNEIETDLELVSSIMNRLYRSDLSKSYYTDEGIYYERLKDFGVIYYMGVVSSIEQDVQLGETKKHRMPTQKLEDLDQAARDKKVAELYPVFEKELKENIVEYGRTIKSLRPDEMVVFNVRMTKCEKCGIPSTLELSVKNSVLREFSEGKITKEAAAGRISVKKGPAQ